MKDRTLLIFLAVLTGVVAFAAGPAMANLAAGVTLDFNANDPASGVDSANWNSLTADSSQDWDFGSDVTLENVSSGASDMTKAYLFTGVTGDDNPTWNNYSSSSDATFELWLKPSDTGDDGQVIFESGASVTGMAIWYAKGTDSDNVGTINFTIDNGSNQGTVSAEIDTSDFRHIVCVYTKDIDGSTDLMQIYVDGELADDNTDLNPTGLNDWSGTHGSGLGGHIGALCEGAQSGEYEGYISIFRFWEGKALSGAEVVGNYGLYAGGYITVIYPENGAVVPPGDVTLEWMNYDDPCTPEIDTVSVDVWWGTDPNRYSGNYTQAASGENVTSATISPAGPGVYYWYVDNTITLAGGDPCTLEGRVFMFTNDGPIESVDAGPDMVTWVGEPVSLVADVNDDGGSALSYSWTASEAPGVTTTFSDASAPTPNVTFTRGTYVLPYIVNESFEDPELSDGSQMAAQYGGSVPPWLSAWKQTASTDWNFHTWRGGAYNPTVDEYTAIPDGENVAWVTASSNPDYEHCIYQQPGLTIEAGKTYELSAMAGSRLTNLSTNDYRIEIVGSGIAANSGSQPSPAAGDWVNTTISYTATASDPNIGEPLTIRLVSEGGSSTTGPDFDSVVLKVDGATGSVEYDLKSTVTVTATVQDETNPAVSGSMNVEIYEDACAAAIDGIGIVYDTDYDIKDCLVNMTDLATMSASWLSDNSASDYIVADPGPRLAGELNVLDVTGINPATGEQWAAGDTYRLAFVTEGTRDATDPNIATYDAFVQAAADAAGLGGVTWKCVGSHYGDGSSTDYNGIRDANVGRMATEVPTYLVDGKTKLWDEFLNGNLANTYSMTETGGTWLGNVGTGAGRLFGDPGQTNIERGDSTRTDGAWWRVYNGAQTSQWHFYAVSEPLTVIVPIVDAGEKVSTWLGIESTMAPIVEDPCNPAVLFDYNWTAEAPAWMAVGISDPSIEAPGVTVTRVDIGLHDAEVANPSFEQVTSQSSITTSRDSWGHYNRPPGTGYALQYVPNSTYHFPDGTTPDGLIICRAATSVSESRPDGLAMILDEKFDPSKNYTLSVAVGHPFALPEAENPTAYDETTWRGYIVQLVAGGEVESTGSGADNVYGGTVIAEDVNSIDIPPRTWATSTVQYTPNAAMGDLAGQPLQIRLLAKDDADPAYPYQTKVFFDNVQLITDAEPALEPVKMTLTVNRQGETETFSDSVTVDVYEDGCELVKALYPESIDQTDHNVDCVTNMKDFAELAADWLVDYALTAPEAKPVE